MPTTSSCRQHSQTSFSCRPIETSPAPRSRWWRCRAANRSCAGSSTPLRDQFDHIFIDCPPSLGLLTLNALVAAEAVLIPLHCEYFALEGLADLMTTLRRVRAGLNPSLDVDGVLLTMYDERTNLGAQVASQRARVFQGESVRDRHPAQRAPRRSAEPRVAGDRVRRQNPEARKRTSRSRASFWPASTSQRRDAERDRRPQRTKSLRLRDFALRMRQKGLPWRNDLRSARDSARSFPTCPTCGQDRRRLKSTSI